MSDKIYNDLVSLFQASNAHFRIVEHNPVNTSLEASIQRGTYLGQGAKAMVCSIRISSTKRKYVLAVFPADKTLDFEKVTSLFGGKRTSLATLEKVNRLTDCEMGAVPPVSFNPELELVIDKELTNRFEEIAFNAGLNNKSIIINSRDYLKIVNPKISDITL